MRSMCQVVCNLARSTSPGWLSMSNRPHMIERTKLDLHRVLALVGGVQPGIADLSKAIVSKPSGERIFVNLLQTKSCGQVNAG